MRPFFLPSIVMLLAVPTFLQAEKKEPAVKLSKVVLFNSGVGFFEHGGKVEGESRLDLKFRVEDVNDLLKSMVVQDLGGGTISTVNYGSKDPITKTLKTFAIDLTTNPTLGDLLRQIRGEKVSVDAPNAIVGAILGVEKRRQPAGKDGETVEAEFLNLLTDDGLRSVPLASVGRIKLLSEPLDAELRQALLILATAHATDKKTVSLHFRGRGQRDVRVGYIQEAPIWKTSYRLVLADDQPPFLQGWAIVENTTEEDWKGVDLTLVSGRPISFIMDLYQPLYVARQVVEPELFASLRPQTYGQDLANRDAEFRKLAERGREAEGLAEKAAQRRAGVAPADAMLRGGGMGGLGVAPGAAKPAARMDLQQGVQSVAQAADLGELFRYAIENPVDLPRQQSAMLPIVNGSVEGEKVSIYNPTVHAKHPLSGLKLKNSTGLHLMQGPITVFDDGAYAGDAQIQDLPPGSERLISYAMDLDTEVAIENKATNPQQLTQVRLVKGTLHITHQHNRSQQYTIKNSGRDKKKVLVEYPFDPAWTLVAPEKADEKTRDLYRFDVQAAPGKPATLTVSENRLVSQQVVVTNMDNNAILLYVNSPVVKQEVKDALRKVIDQKRKIEDVARHRGNLEQQIKEIDQEQNRIRQNMAQLDRTTELYQRYVKKFGEQEDKVEQLRGEIRKLEAEEARLRKTLDDELNAATIG